MTPEQLAKNGSEHGEQCAVFCWASQNLDRYPMLKWMHAIPNGGKRDKITGGMLKAEGVKAGVADIFLPFASDRWHGLYVEMKRAKGTTSDITQEQLAFRDWCESAGYVWRIAWGWKDAVSSIEWYLRQSNL